MPDPPRVFNRIFSFFMYNIAPIVPSPRLGTRDIPGFNQKPSRGVPAPSIFFIIQYFI